MELPSDIEQQVLEYLRLEFGEDPDSEDSIQLSDLKYEGVYEIDGVSTHCWSFPSTEDDIWATVAPYGDTYCISMSGLPEALRDKPYAVLKVIILGGHKKTVKIPYIKDEQYKIASFEKPADIALDDGRTLRIHSEIHFTPIPTQGVISVSCHPQEITLRFGVGAELSIQLDADTMISIKVGDLSWR